MGGRGGRFAGGGAQEGVGEKEGASGHRVGGAGAFLRAAWRMCWFVHASGSSWVWKRNTPLGRG